MGQSHTFFAIDINKLKGVFGSKNDKLLRQILKSQKKEIDDNDACFEEEIEDGEVPATETALRQIFYGDPQMDAEGAMYGYALKIICQQLGEIVEGGKYGVADVTDHPYKSLLAKSGVPIPIPEPRVFPMIGYLALDQIDAEIARATGEHQKTRRSGINAKQIQEDIDAYVETLTKAKQIRKGVVSFRH